MKSPELLFSVRACHSLLEANLKKKKLINMLENKTDALLGGKTCFFYFT